MTRLFMPPAAPLTAREIIEEIAIVNWIDPSLPTREIINDLITLHVRQSWDPAISGIARKAREAIEFAQFEYDYQGRWSTVLEEFDKQKGYTKED